MSTDRPARRMWPWAAAGALAGLLATLVLHWPARWVAPALERASGGHLRLDDVQGTLWTGSAVLSLGAGPGSRDLRTLPGRTRWRLRPGLVEALPNSSADVGTTSGANAEASSGWTPGLRLQLGQDCCLRAPLSVQWALATSTFSGRGMGLRFGALDWQGPLALVQGLGAPWNTLGFEGRLRLSTPGFTRLGPALDGHLSLTAESVSTRIAPIDSLGSYRFDIDGQAGTRGAARHAPMRLALQTLEGPLRLTGQGAWTGSGVRFSADAQAEQGHEAALSHVLRLIGNRNGPVTLRVLR